MEYHEWEESLGWLNYMYGWCAECGEEFDHPNHHEENSE